jgi:N-acetylglucosaminyldiphosphoundecaprenol N-acetyl-beta-D-mannosaminyltransferase
MSGLKLYGTRKLTRRDELSSGLKSVAARLRQRRIPEASVEGVDEASRERQVGAASELGGISISNPSGLHKFEWSGRPRYVTTLNAELILLARRSPDFGNFLRHNIITVDGQWTLWAMRRKHRNGVAVAKQSGYDLLQGTATACARDGRGLFLLGASTEANARAVERLAADHGCRVGGFSPPHAPFPFPESMDELIRAEVATARPDVLVVGFGAPKQEFWARDHAAWLSELGVSYVLFLGGAIDMVGGKVRRAPRLVRRLGLESLYRLAQSPERFRRELRKLAFLWLFLTGKL